MKDIMIKNHFILRLSFIAKICLYLLFNILFNINCKTENGKNILNDNNNLLILTKGGYLQALEKGEKKEKWKIFFNNMEQKFSNSYKLDENLLLYPINGKLFISNENRIIPFDLFVKDLI